MQLPLDSPVTTPHEELPTQEASLDSLEQGYADLGYTAPIDTPPSNPNSPFITTAPLQFGPKTPRGTTRLARLDDGSKPSPAPFLFGSPEKDNSANSSFSFAIPSTLAARLSFGAPASTSNLSKVTSMADIERELADMESKKKAEPGYTAPISGLFSTFGNVLSTLGIGTPKKALFTQEHDKIFEKMDSIVDHSLKRSASSANLQTTNAVGNKNRSLQASTSKSTLAESNRPVKKARASLRQATQAGESRKSDAAAKVERGKELKKRMSATTRLTAARKNRLSCSSTLFQQYLLSSIIQQSKSQAYLPLFCKMLSVPRILLSRAKAHLVDRLDSHRRLFPPHFNSRRRRSIRKRSRRSPCMITRARWRKKRARRKSIARQGESVSTYEIEQH